jgi:hypothetical protein
VRLIGLDEGETLVGMDIVAESEDDTVESTEA